MEFLQKFLLGLIIFGSVIFIGVLVIGNFNSNYSYIDNINESKYSGINHQTDKIYNDSQLMKSRIFGEDINGTGIIDEDNVAESLYKGAYGTIILVKNSFGIVGGIIQSILVELQVPYANYISNIMLSAFIIMVVFAIVFLIFGLVR